MCFEADSLMFSMPSPNEENITKAIELYKESVNLGNPKAMMALGRIYEEGIGCKADLEQAANYYEQAV